MQTSWNENRARLVGTIQENPVFSHSNHGEDFFRLTLSACRLSGTEDRVHLLLPRPLLEAAAPALGDRIAVEGEVRSYNNRSGIGAKLVITVLVRSLTPAGEEPDDDRVTLAGVICRPPTYRRTPLGREICDLLLAVNRRCGRADYLPCIAWGALAQTASRLSVGDGLSLQGRLQSRVYTKLTENGPERRTAFEVSIMTLEVR